jgi:lipoate-protein ligase A
MLLVTDDPIELHGAFLGCAYEDVVYYSGLENNTTEETLKFLLAARDKRVIKMKEYSLSDEDIKKAFKYAANKVAKYLEMVGITPDQLY